MVGIVNKRYDSFEDIATGLDQRAHRIYVKYLYAVAISDEETAQANDAEDEKGPTLDPAILEIIISFANYF